MSLGEPDWTPPRPMAGASPPALVRVLCSLGGLAGLRWREARQDGPALAMGCASLPSWLPPCPPRRTVPCQGLGGGHQACPRRLWSLVSWDSLQFPACPCPCEQLGPPGAGLPPSCDSTPQQEAAFPLMPPQAAQGALHAQGCEPQAEALAGRGLWQHRPLPACHMPVLPQVSQGRPQSGAEGRGSTQVALVSCPAPPPAPSRPLSTSPSRTLGASLSQAQPQRPLAAPGPPHPCASASSFLCTALVTPSFSHSRAGRGASGTVPGSGDATGAGS